jgi:predicted Fe-S protein YdhL (DUF1289 family)
MASKWDNPKERQKVFASAKFGHTGAVREAVLGGFPPTAVDQNAYTLLHHVVCAKVNSLVPFLLEHGWDVNARTNDEGMPVHYACGRGQVEVVQWLVQAGASLNAAAEKGVTPVHIAACYDRKDRVQMLEWLATRVEVDWHHQLDKGSDCNRCHGGAAGPGGSVDPAASCVCGGCGRSSHWRCVWEEMNEQ